MTVANRKYRELRKTDNIFFRWSQAESIERSLKYQSVEAEHTEKFLKTFSLGPFGKRRSEKVCSWNIFGNYFRLRKLDFGAKFGPWLKLGVGWGEARGV